MSGFRKQFYVLTETPSGYVDGEYVAGTQSAFTIMASIQPVRLGQDMESLPEGRRLSDFCKSYTSNDLKTVRQLTGGSVQQPDLIVWPDTGYAYEITEKQVRQMGVINHYRYIASKCIEITGTLAEFIAGWEAGTITR